MSATRDRSSLGGRRGVEMESWLDVDALRRQKSNSSNTRPSSTMLFGGRVHGDRVHGDNSSDDDGALDEIKRALAGFPRDLAAKGDMTMPLDLVTWRHFLSDKCGWDILPELRLRPGSSGWNGDGHRNCDYDACSGMLPSRSLMFHVSRGPRSGVVPVFGFGGGHRPGDRSDRAVLDVLDAIVRVRGDEDAVLLHASPVVIVSKDAPDGVSGGASDRLLSVPGQPRILMFGGWLVSRGVVRPFCLCPGSFGAAWDQWGKAAGGHSADQWDSVRQGGADQGVTWQGADEQGAVERGDADPRIVDLDAYRRSRRVDLHGARAGACGGLPGGRDVCVATKFPTAGLVRRPPGVGESDGFEIVHDVALGIEDPSPGFFRTHSWPDPGAMLALVASLDGHCLVSRALRSGAGKASQAPRVTCRDVAMLRIGAGRWRLPVLKSTLIGDPSAKRGS